MQQNPAPCPSPQTSTETNGAGIFPNRIIRSMSLHTFTYLRAYSRPPLEGASNRDGSDNISMATPPLKNGGSHRERSDDLFFFFNIRKYNATHPGGPLGSQGAGLCLKQ